MGELAPRWAEGPPKELKEDSPHRLGWMDWEADEQDMVSPRGVRRLLRGSGKPRKAWGCALQIGHTPPNKEHPSPSAEGPEGHRVVTWWRQSLDPLAGHTGCGQGQAGL